MSARDRIEALAREQGAVVSVHLATLDGTTLLELDAERTHPAASTLKVALVQALIDSGTDLHEEIAVTDTLPSAGGGSFATTADYDNDPLPWQRLGGTAALGWLAERAIVRSSNLATNLLLDRLGLDAVNAVYTGTGCRVERAIQDPAPGHENVVTARGLSAVLRLLDPRVEGLMARCEDVGMAAGLPDDAVLAHKPGWFEGVCHDHGIVRAPGEPARTLSILTGAELDGDEHVALLQQIATVAWEAR